MCDGNACQQPIHPLSRTLGVQEEGIVRVHNRPQQSPSIHAHAICSRSRTTSSAGLCFIRTQSPQHTFFGASAIARLHRCSHSPLQLLSFASAAALIRRFLNKLEWRFFSRTLALALIQHLFSSSLSCRFLLLTTIPILIFSLLVLIISNIVELGTVVHAILSTISVIEYFCCFVMGFGPIPNILCSEIFPTRVHGICIAICALVFWIGDIIVTYSRPVMLNSIGLAGVFGIYAIVCAIAFIFVFFRVPRCPSRSLPSSSPLGLSKSSRDSSHPRPADCSCEN
ncbi:Monosaccharide-sensing protein 2 [Apostasia shenzhenica]|uniref:Monosaccharide-sensing protein 2 n=1 Tax=Apostasia shenzhenica TaxID=1088818 RepID=A0A2I0A9B7_9ASPA|nr:Monosaccharide-sensing protein 2 [Apostasia shenzhenica]